jgi:hypothetical protein
LESLFDLSTLYSNDDKQDIIEENDFKELLKHSLDSLPNDKISLEALIDEIWIDITKDDRKPWNWGLFYQFIY